MGSNNITHEDALSGLRNKIEEYRRSIVNSEIRIAAIKNLIAEIEDHSKMLGMIGKPIKRGEYSEYKDDLACGSEDGFIPINIGTSITDGITPEMGVKYAYNKDGKVKNLLTGKEIRLHHHEFRGVVNGVCYEFYIPRGVINASRVVPIGDMEDDLIFDTIKEACEHFGCTYKTLKGCIDKSGEKAFKGYWFETGWPKPFVTRVVNIGGKDEK